MKRSVLFLGFFVLMMGLLVAQSIIQVDVATYNEKTFKWQIEDRRASVEIRGAGLDAVWLAMLKSLAKNFWAIESQDKEAGTITAQQVKYPGTNMETRWSLVVGLEQLDQAVRVDVDGTAMPNKWIANILKVAIANLQRVQ